MSDQFSLSGALPSLTPQIDPTDLAAGNIPANNPSFLSRTLYNFGQDLAQQSDFNRLYGRSGLGGFGQSRMALPNVPNAPSAIAPSPQTMGRNRIAQQLAGLPTINDPSGGGGW